LVRERWKAVAISPSAPGMVRSRNSITSTSAPSRRQTEPSSSPMMPAPITTSFLGTGDRPRAPVESTMRFWSTVTPGSGEGSEPVAMTILAVSRVVSDPSSAFTSTLPGAAMAPAPLIQSTLFFLNRNSTPLVRAVTLSSFCFSICGRSSCGSTLMPRLAKPVLASSNMCEALSRALEGMQPTFRQVPPSVLRFSTQATFRPSWPARIAAL
jgi:hypothetical protein